MRVLHSPPMEILSSTVDTRSDRFKENDSHHRALVMQLRQRQTKVREGGGEKYRERHVQQGKLFVRDRIDRLLDPGSPFLEMSPLDAWEMYDGDAPCARLITGSGRIAGVECLLVANDATVKGGTYYPIT